MKLKILSLWQPHATLCVTPSKENPEVPAKPVETRHWPTNHRGWLGIHSAMMKDKFYASLCELPVFKWYIEDFKKLPFGYILGMVNISGCLGTQSVELSKFILDKADHSANRAMGIITYGNFDEGRFGFTISDFVQFTTPVKAKGGQGFWYHEMPNHIGERVKTLSNGPGIILDYNPDKPLWKWLIKTDKNGTRDWYGIDAFHIIENI